jgi:hypothetical protein
LWFEYNTIDLIAVEVVHIVKSSFCETVVSSKSTWEVMQQSSSSAEVGAFGAGASQCVAAAWQHDGVL